VGCAGAPPTAPIDAGVPLAWSAAVDGDLELFVRLPGAAPRRFGGPGPDYAAPSGPAAAWIHADADGGEQLWTWAGAGEPALRFAAPRVRAPRWAPDGSALAWESDADAAFRDIWAALADGAPRRLSRSALGCFDPAPGPGGAWAVAPCSGADLDLHVVDGEDRPPRRLLARPGEDLAPALRPDGLEVAFFAGGGDALEVHLVGVDGQGHRTLWAPPPAAGRPAEEPAPEQGLWWSPGGELLAFTVRAVDGAPSVRVIAAATGAERLRAPGELPGWGAGGELIYTGDDADGSGVFALDLAGGGPRRAAPVGAWLGRGLQIGGSAYSGSGR